MFLGKRKPSKTPLTDLGRSAARQGVATSRFRVTPEQAAEIRKAEAVGGHQAGLAVVLRLIGEARRTEIR